MHSSDSRKEKEKDNRITKRYIFRRRLCTQNDTNITEEKILELLELLRTGIESGNSKEISEALHQIRGGLACAEHVDTAVSGNIMSLMDFCLEQDELSIKYSAIWILTNIACGDSDYVAMVAARLEKILPILRKDVVDEEVLAQGLWLLANVAGDSPDHRDSVVHHFSFDLLGDFVSQNSSAQVLENAVWLLSNIARQGPRADQQMCQKILDILNKVLDFERCDCKVISEACRALLNVLHNLAEPKTLELATKSRILSRMARHPNLRHCNRSCFGDLVLLVADFLSADNHSCQVFIDQGILNVLSIVMHEEISELYYSACFAIANVFACSSAQIQCAINNNLLTAAIYHLEHGDLKVQREAAIALCSFIGNAHDRQILQAFNKGLVPPMVRMLSNFDASIVYDVLASLVNLLDIAKDLKMEEDFLHEMLDCDIERKLRRLMEHGHEQVSELARSFIHVHLVPRGFTTHPEEAFASEKFAIQQPS
ncbi:importin subunit alpha-3-like [Galendromus occidentalis]|uniref:Importin subunit alpha-3-like n=1 Tax=Galendromus occidentalis TaxID=34638 RepID=A0AAJ7P9V2_9ACAR|nr:importin subunit alpha-3-like [Galendromus occidentalis]